MTAGPSARCTRFDGAPPRKSPHTRKAARFGPQNRHGSRQPFSIPKIVFASSRGRLKTATRKSSLAAGSVPVPEVLLTIALLALTLAAVTWIAGKIYRIGILMHGTKPTYKVLWKWIKASQ